MALVMIGLASCTQHRVSVITHPSKVSGPTPRNPYSVTTKTGDTLVSLSEKYRIRTSELIALNHLHAPYHLSKGTILKLPAPQYHIVQKGDTLYGIARSYLVDVATLVQVNHLDNPEHILTGTKLYFSSATAEVATDREAVSLQSHESSPSEGTQNGAAIPTPSAGSTSHSGVTVDELKPLNTTATPSPSSETLTPKQAAPAASSADDHVTIAPEAPAPDIAATPQKPATSADVTTTTARATPSASSASDTPAITAQAAKPSSASSATAPTSVSRTSSESFLWPVRGKVISRFGPRKGGLYNDGVNISAPEGSDVKAAADGVVVYSGNELRGYGNLLLIKHSNGFVTAYAHTAKNAVQKDAIVRKGDTIAYVGKTGHVSSPQLHFSIRKDRKALNPEKYLPVVVSNQ